MSIMYDFNMLVAPLHACLSCLCCYLFVCVCHKSCSRTRYCAPLHACLSCLCFYLFVCVCHKSCPRTRYCAGLHPSIYTKPQTTFRSFACWLVCCSYFNSMDLLTQSKPTFVTYKSIHISSFVCLFVFACLLPYPSCAFYMCFVCFPSMLACLVWCLHVCFSYGGWSTCLTSKKQAKWHRLVYFRRLTLREVHYFLSLSFRTMYSGFHILGFSSCTLLWVIRFGGYVFILALFFQCKYCDCFIM